MSKLALTVWSAFIVTLTSLQVSVQVWPVDRAESASELVPGVKWPALSV